MQDTTARASAASRSLASDLGELLLELAVALHKRAIYPSDHPMLAGAVDTLLTRLGSVLQDRPSVALGVARRQVIVEGVATDPNHPLLRELAEHLHAHQLGAVRFLAGIEREELDGFLDAVSVSAFRIETPLGQETAATLTRWRHIALFPITFDRLHLLEDGEVGREASDSRESRTHAAQLWIGLARAALAGDVMDDEGILDPSFVAGALDLRLGEKGYDQVVIGYLLQMGHTMNAKDNAPVESLKRRVSQLVRSLRKESLVRLLEMGGDVTQRNQFVINAADSLAVGAVLDIVSAAADAQGKSISHSLSRLLQKLGSAAGERSASPADRELRSQVKRLVTDWTLQDPNPEAYSAVLTQMSRSTAPRAADEGRDVCEPERMLEISLEAHIIGPSTELAIARLVEREGLTETLDRISKAPESAQREVLVDRLLSDAMLAEQLATDRPDQRLLEHLVARVRVKAVAPLLDALQARDEKDAEWICQHLVRIGDVAAPIIGERFRSFGAVNQRALLAVFETLNAWPEQVRLTDLVRHPDLTLRRDVFRLLLKREETRDRATVAALREADERCFSLGLAAAARQCSQEAAAALIMRLDDEKLSEELRARGTRILASSRSEAGMRWLTAFLLTTHWLTKATRLRRKSPSTLAALSGLAAHWTNDADVQRIIAMAAQSRDEDVRRAVVIRAAGTPIHASEGRSL